MGQIDLYYKPWTYFWIIEFIALIMLALGMWQRFSFYLRGTRQSLHEKPDYRLMLQAFWRDVVLQKQLAQKSKGRWFIHMCIFYGFLGLLLLSAISVALETFVPAGSAFSRYMLTGHGQNYYKAAGDVFGTIIFVGLLLAVSRRYIIRDAQLNTDTGDTVTLLFLLGLVMTGFLLEAVRISVTANLPGAGYSFIGCRLAQWFQGYPGSIASLAAGLWVFHATLTAVFLAYLPHSKFLHIINAPVEIVINASEERMRGDLYL